MGMTVSWDDFEPVERPIAEVGQLQSIFVNGVSSVDLIGSNNDCVRITYYVDGRAARLDGGPVEKIPVVEIIFPLADLTLCRAEISARLKAFGVKWGNIGTVADC